MRITCVPVLLVTMLCCITLHGQAIRGFVYENATSNPISQADVFIIGEPGTFQFQTDVDGKFVFEPESTGRFDVIVSHLGYELVHLQALRLGSTKDLVLDIPMTARIRELAEVNVLAPSVRRIQNRFYTTSVEETTRFPGTFFDPARTATLFPGVSAANDQANGLIIHGLNPNLMRWYLEGVPILNPNHLANAGTLSDRATPTGGGVNMLSNQVLATTSLVSGALPARYGDATSGVMDMQFRPGTMVKPEHTVQAGLLGLELASEGRIGESDASYLANYRYSTVGLLSALGVDFGDEKISFQDLNFNVHIPLKTQGAYVRFFGVGGLNSNELDGPQPVEERENSRDISEVDYGAGAVIAGASFQWPTRNGLIKAATALSYLDNRRMERRLAETLPGTVPYSSEDARQTQVSTLIEWQGPRVHRFILNAGISLINQWIDEAGFYPQSGDYLVNGRSTHFRPFGQVSYVLTGDVVIRGGLGVSFLSGRRAEEESLNSKVIPEPSLHIYWQAGDKFSLESGYSYSGITTPRVTYQQGSTLDPDLLRTHTYSLIFRNQITSGTQLAGIMHYYALSHVPADADSTSGHSILSDSGYPRPGAYEPEGRGRAISLALALRRDVRQGKFARAGIGWIHATHQGAAGILHSTAWDIGPWAFAAGGQEWTSVKTYGVRTLGVNAAIHWRGGLRDQEIDLAASREAGYTRYLDEGDFSVELEDYFRIDLRVYLRKDKSNKSTIWSLDIQNLSSRENAFFSLYDPFQDNIRQTMQLGIVPVISYRVDF